MLPRSPYVRQERRGGEEGREKRDMNKSTMRLGRRHLEED
jgi:hypothetical protein